MDKPCLFDCEAAKELETKLQIATDFISGIARAYPVSELHVLIINEACEVLKKMEAGENENN